MTQQPVVTREIARLPTRATDAHKGEVGRIVIIGGCTGETTMVGAVALSANAAYRSGAGLVQMIAPETLQVPLAIMAPCATLGTLPDNAASLLGAIEAFHADAIALGPGMGDSMTRGVLLELLTRCTLPFVVDADGINLLASTHSFDISEPRRIVLTPHVGEMRRLLARHDIELTLDKTAESRRAAAVALAQACGCVVVLKGHQSVVTDGKRLYVNESGNAGMATGGAGDVLTGIIAALIGQKMDTLEAAILGAYLHGLAGDFASEELGRWSVTAADLIDYLPDAFGEHDVSTTE